MSVMFTNLKIQGSRMKMQLVTMFVTLMQISALCASYDLVEVVKINPNIRLDIKYATTTNFTGKILYPSARCYLRSAVAQKLDKVQKELEAQGLGLKVFDGYRPRSVQYKMWEVCPDDRYVADPAKGSKHNRGSAVDCTLIDSKTGQELEMPSAYDDLTEKAHRNYDKMPSEAAKKNCKRLEDSMAKHGFVPLPTEWWHFDDAEWEKYELLDVSFDQLEQSIGDAVQVTPAQ